MRKGNVNVFLLKRKRRVRVVASVTAINKMDSSRVSSKVRAAVVALPRNAWATAAEADSSRVMASKVVTALVVVDKVAAAVSLRVHSLPNVGKISRSTKKKF